MSLYDSLQDKLESTHVYSGYFSALCPFHNDSSPSFFVYEESDKKSMEYRCASCGAHGTLAYLDRYLGYHHRRTLTQSQSKPTVLPRWRRWEQEYGGLDGIVQYAHENLMRHKQFQNYFERRKINGFIEQGSFGYLDGWATFPVYSYQHSISTIVVRAINKGSTRYVINGHGDALYCPNWDRLSNEKIVYVCFGIIDSWAFESIGKACVTGITGKSLSADQLKPLGKRFIIVPDLDEEREAYWLSNKLGWRAKVQLLKYEENTKDPDDIRRIYGNEKLLQLLGA